MHYFWFGLENLSGSNSSLGQRLLMAYPANHLLLDMLKTEAQAPCRFYLPACCRTPDLDNLKEVFFYPAESPVEPIQRTEEDYLLLSNGAVFAKVDETYLREVLSSFDWEAAAFRIDPSLDAGCEQVQQTADGRIVGFRRQYQPAVEPDIPSEEQPDFLCCKADMLEGLLHFLFERSWGSFAELSEGLSGTVLPFRIGGQRLDLFSEAGLAKLLRYSQTCRTDTRINPNPREGRVSVRGIVHGGRNIQIGPDTVIAAPAILCDGVQIGERTVLHGVFLGPSVRVPAEQRHQGKALWNGRQGETVIQMLPIDSERFRKPEKPFRQWPLFSYPRLGKRLVDILISGFVLLLLLPFLPLIALAVKLTSPGPVFYRARRQGLHGRQFSCLKFRTMIVGADSLQEHLRDVNQVDGPQFKMEDDPRTSPIGRFLRDTCIDELPQFFNVLLGQMSVVGPRPSPEHENEFCPVWRQARLSVRPGITGWWQVNRTRLPGRDFQEWIYYDMDYVRRLSLGMDLRICLMTARKLIGTFLDQFG